MEPRERDGIGVSRRHAPEGVAQLTEQRTGLRKLPLRRPADDAGPID